MMRAAAQVSPRLPPLIPRNIFRRLGSSLSSAARGVAVVIVP